MHRDSFTLWWYCTLWFMQINALSKLIIWLVQSRIHLALKCTYIHKGIQVFWMNNKRNFAIISLLTDWFFERYTNIWWTDIQPVILEHKSSWCSNLLILKEHCLVMFWFVVYDTHNKKCCCAWSLCFILTNNNSICPAYFVCLYQSSPFCASHCLYTSANICLPFLDHKTTQVQQHNHRQSHLIMMRLR